VYVVVATWVAKEGEEEAVEDLLRRISAETEANETGCREFTVYRSKSDARHYLLYERYDDEAAFQAHRQSTHFQKYVLDDAVANERLEERYAKFYETLD
jgi:quinol monooxygenase YgiN